MKKIIFYLMTFITSVVSSIVAYVSFLAGNVDACFYAMIVGIISFALFILVFIFTNHIDLGGAGFFSDYDGGDYSCDD